jgi:hypothetical protein
MKLHVKPLNISSNQPRKLSVLFPSGSGTFNNETPFYSFPIVVKLSAGKVRETFRNVDLMFMETNRPAESKLNSEVKRKCTGLLFGKHVVLRILLTL